MDFQSRLKTKTNSMDATSNFSRRFAQALEWKVRMADRLLTGQTLERIATGMSLISQAFGFWIFGTLIIANRHQADLSGFSGGSSFAVAGAAGAILVGTAFLFAAGLYGRSCARSSVRFSADRDTARFAFSIPESTTAIAAF